MVKELRVEDPNEGKFAPEREESILCEMVYLGVEIPEELKEQRRERLGWVPADRDPRSVASEKQWLAYFTWLGEQPELADASPAERLGAYAAKLSRDM